MNPTPISRRRFVQTSAAAAAGVLVARKLPGAAKSAAPAMSVADLPKGNAPAPLALPHFPDRLHAFLWRNWTLVPLERLATVVGASQADLLKLGQAMGLPKPPRISKEQQRRSYLTVIKRNWHLLPYDQLLTLLDWAPEQMAFTLREDDFFYIKLGSHKPACEPLRYVAPTAAAQRRAAEIAEIIKRELTTGAFAQGSKEPLFAFVGKLSGGLPPRANLPGRPPVFAPRFCYSYFALYGDPLLEPEADPYPDAYLARLAASGVDGVWLQAVLYKLAPFPWQTELSARYEERLRSLRRLVARARNHGIGLWLYLNEPRAMPLKFFAAHPELKGVTEGDHATLCTSHAEVQRYLSSAVASICRAVPDLAGFFTITASENLTNCWSHHQGKQCARCGQRPPGEVIAEVNRLIVEGIQTARANSHRADTRSPRLIAWDWGWDDAWALDAIARLPQEAALMSVSEWSLPIERGGVKSAVGEYSISAVGPGPRALRHWKLARQRGLKTIAKIQAGCTWELSAVPYIPAVANVARHAANLRDAKVDGLMLGWTLGGCPSPNLEVIAEIARSPEIPPDEALRRVAERRFAPPSLIPRVVEVWKELSAAFCEFPYAIGTVYSAPLQLGPANLLWAAPTGYRASMVGFPYDDLNSWRSIYPPGIFIAQLEKVAIGFEAGARKLLDAASLRSPRDTANWKAEVGVIQAAAIHFQSVANQARFVVARQNLATAKDAAAAGAELAALERILRHELDLARRLWQLQQADSRLGFEASNQYFYVPQDLAEKVLNCRDLLDRWLPEQKRQWGISAG